MRVVPIITLALAVFLGWAGGAAGQGKGKKDRDDKDKDKKPATTITEIGGKALEQWIAEIPSKDRTKSSVAIKTVPGFGPERAAKAVPVIIAELKKHQLGVTVDASVRVNG